MFYGSARATSAGIVRSAEGMLTQGAIVSADTIADGDRYFSSLASSGAGLRAGCGLTVFLCCTHAALFNSLGDSDLRD